MNFQNGANNQLIYFTPTLGACSSRLWELVEAAEAGSLSNFLDSQLDWAEDQAPPTHDSIKYHFCVSLLHDLVRAGGTAWVRDSRLIASWPNWKGAEGRLAARNAMQLAREMRPLSRQELEKTRPMFAPDLEPNTLMQILRRGRFELVPAKSRHPCGATYSDAFAVALRHWSMPYRGRTGRKRRFVLTVHHEAIGQYPVVVGIIELGDEAPFCAFRDDMLGLSRGSAANWINSSAKDRVSAAAARLTAIRSCLLPTSDGLDFGTIDASRIVLQAASLHRAALGRSLGAETEPERLRDQKRITYALRLARGEAYLTQLATDGQPIDPGKPEFAAGVRALHDLVVPRVHMEVTLCGAIPPFSEAFGGKLVVSFFTHPKILEASKTGLGELVGWSFDSQRLGEIIADQGLLCLTTKGLYSEHAPIYNRSAAPGAEEQIRMVHLANTEGATSNLVSTRTARIAQKVVDTSSLTQSPVSLTYGSGGAKRHRLLEAAARVCGLSGRAVMAGTRRPVYGMKFVDNPEAVIWGSSSPRWLAALADAHFDHRAANFWRDRWLEKAYRRTLEYALIPSLPSILKQGLPSK